VNAIELLIEAKTTDGNDVVSSYRGRPRDDLRLKEPEEIFSTLGVKSASSKRDALEAIGDLLVRSRKQKDFANAFGKPFVITDKRGKNGIFVPIGNIDIKSMTQYLALWIIAAFNGKYINSREDIRVQHDSRDRGAVIYKSRRGRATWDETSAEKKPEQSQEGG